MNRPASVVLLVIVAGILGAPRPAAAGLLSWLDKLSGPGPFLAFDFGLCIDPKPSTHQARQTPSRKETDMRLAYCSKRLTKPGLTWWVNGSVAGSLKNELQYDSGDGRNTSKTVWLIKTGVSADYTLFPQLDLGVGVGYLFLAGERFDTFALPYVEFVRVTVRPFMSQFDDGEPKKRTALLLFFTSDVLVGTLNGAKFGAPGDRWSETNDVRWQAGVGIDIARLTGKGRLR